MKKIKLTENERKALLTLKESLKEKFNLIDFFIFGSKARGEASSDSDIDVMIELENCAPETESLIYDIVFEINLAHDCFISTIIFTRKELIDGPLAESPIYKTIMQEGTRI
jgi:predicted nucleotidyltransferase